jgi:hypothetical protein
MTTKLKNFKIQYFKVVNLIKRANYFPIVVKMKENVNLGVCSLFHGPWTRFIILRLRDSNKE